MLLLQVWYINGTLIGTLMFDFEILCQGQIKKPQVSHNLNLNEIGHGQMSRQTVTLLESNVILTVYSKYLEGSGRITQKIK